VRGQQHAAGGYHAGDSKCADDDELNEWFHACLPNKIRVDDDVMDDTRYQMPQRAAAGDDGVSGML
jgi:hypothetical protein